MSVPLSKSQLEKLGRRLRKSDVPAEDDLDLLTKFRAAHDPALAAAQDALRRLGLEPTSRLKTTGTIIDKLAREKTRLGSMHDIAGLRIVEDLSLGAQDELVDMIVAELGGGEIIDRRKSPGSVARGPVDPRTARKGERVEESRGSGHRPLAQGCASGDTGWVGRRSAEVKHFVIVFDRSKGEIVDDILEFGDSEREAALAKRFELERSYSARSEVEVVSLGAASIEDLKRTHTRYFKDELRKRATTLG